jgi:tRNA(Ile)-lysidine synthase
MPEQNLSQRFWSALEKWEILDPDEPVLIGVSGGADSVALLMLFSSADAPGMSRHPIHVAHLNHQLRGEESNEDEAFVGALAKKLSVACTTERVDVGQLADQRGVSIEQAARDARFAFYEKVCLQQGIRAVALAHHADDNVETVIHRLARGTGMRGLAGIRPTRPLAPGSDIRIIRPLLCFRRADILSYLESIGVIYRQDTTNASAAYTRNRIRHEILPLLRDRLNPQVEDAILRLAEQASGLDAYLVETAERMLESLIVESSEDQLVLHSPSLARKPRVIQNQLVRQAILRMGVGERDLTYSHINLIVDLASEAAGTKSLDLPGQLHVSRKYTRLVFQREPTQRPTAVPAEIALHIGTPALLEVASMELTVEEIHPDAAQIEQHIHELANRPPASLVEWIDADEVHPPLLARLRRPGDRFLPLGMGGMKKIADFMIDEKIAVDDRDRTVLVCDRLGPIWVVPWRICHRVRLTERTKRVLQLRARPTQA